jgi:hypothetical protein
MKKTITIAYNFGDEVDLKTEPTIKRIITGLIVRPSGKMYELANGVETSWHQEVEIERFPLSKKAGFK